MPMPVMLVGKMRVAMAHRPMAMRMRMRLRSLVAAMRVLVVSIMDVAMFLPALRQDG